MVTDENGDVTTRLFMRGTPQYVAGSRFKYMVNSIPFNYESLVKAITDAIDMQSQETGGQYITDKATQVITEEVTYDFDALWQNSRIWLVI